MTLPAAARREPLPRPRVRVWWFLLAGLAVLIALPIFAVSSLLRISPENRILGAAAVEAVAPMSGWHRQVDVSVGPWGLGLVRFIAGFVDGGDEARAALGVLSAIDNVQVSVSTPRGWSESPGAVSILAAATVAMGEQSWQRVVAVLDGEEAVAVFVPADLADRGPIPISVMVFSDDTLVQVSTRADLDALVPLIADVSARHHTVW